MVNFSLEGKVALVTGAAYGIGLAIAQAFAEAGAKIVYNCSRRETLERGAAAYKELGIDAKGYLCDVTDEESVKAMVADIEATVGTIDILVNNAGIIKRIPMEEMAADEFRRVIDVDLVGPFICSKAVIPGMKKKGHGKIINICSMMSELGRETVSAYAAAKGGLKMLTRNIASEYGEFNIQCNGIGPGYIATEQTAPLREPWCVILSTVDRTVPRVDWALLAVIFAYSLPLLIGGLAGTANEFIDRQLIKYLVPAGAMAQLGVYGAITKIAVVMMLFYQMYRLAAEPFFLSNFRKSDFVRMNAAALKYYVMASMLIFLGIALFRDFFALIVGRDFREGIHILPVVLGANVLTGVWLNLSFWYKREERTPLAIVVTGSGLAAMLLFGFWFIPLWGYFGAAWARLASESVMVAVSWWLNRRFFPTPYEWGRIGEFVVVALGVFFVAESFAARVGNMFAGYAFNIVLFAGYSAYLVRREHIDVGALVRAALRKK